MEREATIELVSKITEFNDLSDFMKDEDLDLALAYIVKLIAKPDLPFAAASRLVVQLQALSAKFAILARYYTTMEKSAESAKKKNVYYTSAEEIDKLVAAVKYLSKM